MGKCPQCGFNLSKTERVKNVSNKDKEEFVKRNKYMFEPDISKTTIWLARKELNYSSKTIDIDISAGLRKAYRKVFGEKGNRPSSLLLNT